MSKIFEALQKARGDVAEVARPLIQMAQTAGTQERTSEEWFESVAVREMVGPPAPPEVGAKDSPHSDVRLMPLHLQAGSAVLPLSEGDFHASEQYRMIRAKIAQHPGQPKLLAVSSAGSGDGKTISAINIAGVLALRDDVNVLLVDADFRHPDIAECLGIPPTPGLANVILGECALQDAIVRIQQLPNLYVLPAGNGQVNPAEMLESPTWKAVTSAVREHFHFAILDTPPVATVADYELIQVTSDGVILIVRPDHTDRTLCARALDIVPKDKLIGIVMNCSFEWFLWKTHEYHYYGHRAKASSEGFERA